MCDAGNLMLVHQQRRMRVQGIISKTLLDGDLLWPGMSESDFWDKVAQDDKAHYKHEKSVWWDDRKKSLKQVVESKEDREVAVNLLEGFGMIRPMSGDRSEFFCPYLLNQNPVATEISPRDNSCKFWMKRYYIAIPIGFWNTIFMEIRSSSTTGESGASTHVFFLLSAKILIHKKNIEGNKRRIEIEVCASTREAFDFSKAAFDKITKGYRGMDAWEVKNENAEISEEIMSKIIPSFPENMT